jgi:hypothetical protein
LWQEWSQTGDSAPPVEVQEEIILSLERSLQLHPSNADALKALALFHSDIARDENAAATVLQKLAQVPLLPPPALQPF